MTDEDRYKRIKFLDDKSGINATELRELYLLQAQPIADIEMLTKKLLNYIKSKVPFKDKLTYPFRVNISRRYIKFYDAKSFNNLKYASDEPFEDQEKENEKRVAFLNYLVYFDHDKMLIEQWSKTTKKVVFTEPIESYAYENYFDELLLRTYEITQRDKKFPRRYLTSIMFRNSKKIIFEFTEQDKVKTGSYQNVYELENGIWESGALWNSMREYWDNNIEIPQQNIHSENNPSKKDPPTTQNKTDQERSSQSQ